MRKLEFEVETSPGSINLGDTVESDFDDEKRKYKVVAIDEESYQAYFGKNSGVDYGSPDGDKTLYGLYGDPSAPEPQGVIHMDGKLSPKKAIKKIRKAYQAYIKKPADKGRMDAVDFAVDVQEILERTR